MAAVEDTPKVFDEMPVKVESVVMFANSESTNLPNTISVEPSPKAKSPNT
jgi:hypothetical protein